MRVQHDGGRHGWHPLTLEGGLPSGEPTWRDGRQVALCQIYVITCPSAHAFKVGHAHAPKIRLSAVRAHCPLPVVLAGTWLGVREDEMRIHQMLRCFRRHGEWFDAQMAAIDLLRTGVLPLQLIAVRWEPLVDSIEIVPTPHDTLTGSG